MKQKSSLSASQKFSGGGLQDGMLRQPRQNQSAALKFGSKHLWATVRRSLGVLRPEYIIYKIHNNNHQHDVPIYKLTYKII